MRYCLFPSVCYLLVAGVTMAQVNLDPCVKAHRQFNDQASAVETAWHQQNAQISAAVFPRAKFQEEYRKNLQIRALHDLQDSLTALASKYPQKNLKNIPKADLEEIARKKVELSLARPEGKEAMERDTLAAEDYFYKAKADALVKQAQKKSDMDGQINDGRKLLDANCTYDFPSQMTRIAQGAFDEKAKIEDGVLKIITFNSPLTMKGGQLWSGDHPVMDVPVVGLDGVKVGGVSLTPMPSFSGGNLLIPSPLPGGNPIPIPVPHVKAEIFGLKINW